MQNAITFTQTTLIQSERESSRVHQRERERVPQSHEEGESEFLII